MINSRKLDDLLPIVKEKAENLQYLCGKQNIDIIITSTYRDIESQDALYAQGRTTPGSIVTKVRGGDSVHNWRCAFDVVPVVNGKAIWNDNDLWSKIGAIGQSLGLEWGGSWAKFKDRPHFQYLGCLTLSELKCGKVPGGTHA